MASDNPSCRAISERIVQVPASADLPDQPEEPDALVQWLKQHPRSR